MVTLRYTIISAPAGHDDEIGKTFTLGEIAQFLEVNASELARESLLAIQMAADAYIFDIHREEVPPRF